MPAYEAPLRVGSTHVNLVYKGEKYPLPISTVGFTRAGKDGSHIVLPLFGGDGFVGKILEGHWRKGFDANMDADQVFTAILDSSDVLELEGEADVAGTAGYGWLNSALPLPLMDETEVKVSMSVPIDDTGATADRDIRLMFYLMQDRVVTNPSLDTDVLLFYSDVDETGILYYLKRGTTTLFDGSTYDDASARATGDLEAVVIRFLFHGKPGTTGSHVHVYMRQSDTLDNAESAEENELTTSPCDMSSLKFNVAYPALSIYSQNTSYFDAGQEAKVGYIRVTYPNFTVEQTTADANLFLNEVQLWDGDPDTTGVRVYDADHVPNGNLYLRNGLAQIQIKPETGGGLIPYIWDGITYTAHSYFNHYDSNLAANDHTPKKVIIRSISPEKIVVEFVLNQATQRVTMRRGRPMMMFDISFLNKLANGWFRIAGNTIFDYGLSQDDAVKDRLLSVEITEAPLIDNWLECFDIDTYNALIIYHCDRNTCKIIANNSNEHGFSTINNITGIKLWFGYHPWAYKAKMYQEAEIATLAGGADTADVAGDSGTSARLNAQNETVTYTVTAGTHFPAGRYVAIFRVEDTNQVAGDVGVRVYNDTDGVFCNEEGAEVAKTVTAAWLYYILVFDITAADVTGTDLISLRVKKLTATANTIYVDYFMVFPVGDGQNFPQDLAHAALCSVSLDRRVKEK